MSAELQGLDELAQYVRNVNEGLDNRLVRKPITASLRLLVRSMRSRAPRSKRRRRRKGSARTKRLYQSHGYRFRGAKRIVAKAGVNVAKKRPQRAPHAHLVGAGTKERTTKAGAKRGRVPARPWVPDAVLAVADQALDQVLEGIWQALAAEAARHGGRA